MTEKEELQMLRDLTKKQKLQLLEKDNIISEKDNIISKKDDIISEKNEVIRRQQIQIENMTQALLHARKKMFGRSSEASTGYEQLCLFEKTTELAKALLKEQETITVREHKRTPRKPGIRREMLAGLPKEIEEYIIDAEEKCPVCGGELENIGKEFVRTEVEFKPATLIVKQVVRQVAKCKACGSNGNDRPKHIRKASVPAKVLPHSIVTHSLAAQIMYQKFGMGVPFARQEKSFYQMGLEISRANMAHWTIRCSDEWLMPVYDRIHKMLIQKCEILHMDETRIQVNKESGKKAGSDSFVWVLQSGSCEDIKATFFHYSRTRSKKVALDLIEGFKGYLTTDAYAAYAGMHLEDVKNSFCWSHLRRYYIDSIPLDNSGKEIPGSKGAEGREYVNLLFRIEKEISDLSYEDKKAKRQEASRALLDAFWSWVENTITIPTTNEKLTKALNYSLNHKKEFEMFMEDGRLEISNNLCESHIRPFATARRAWLFADTPDGARANAVLYTLVETARANDLNVYAYLDYLLAEMPNADFYNHPEIIDDMLPWSDKLPESCRLINIRKKNFKK